MTTKIFSFISRDPQEIIDIFNFNISMLEQLCADFDKGKTEASLWIAVVLRTLLYSNKKSSPASISIMEQLKNIDSKYDTSFLSTSFPKPQSGNALQGWVFGGNISNVNLTTLSVYAGLLIKTLNKYSDGTIVADVKPKMDNFLEVNRKVTLEDWLNETVFYDYRTNFGLTRLESIKMVANKDGGTHLEQELPIEYDTFRQPTLAKIFFGNQEVPFTRNPVYVSLRQMAWEFLETLKRNRLSEENNDNSETTEKTGKEEEQNDFVRRMRNLKAQGLSVPLTGEGVGFLKGILRYALENSKDYVYFYIPISYKSIVEDDDLAAIASKAKNIEGIVFGGEADSLKDSAVNSIEEKVRYTELSKIPFVIYDDLYYAIEDYDKDSGRRRWIANMKSENVVALLKDFFVKAYHG